MNISRQRGFLCNGICRCKSYQYIHLAASFGFKVQIERGAASEHGYIPVLLLLQKRKLLQVAGNFLQLRIIIKAAVINTKIMLKKQIFNFRFTINADTVY